MRIRTKLWLAGLATAVVAVVVPASASATTATFTSAGPATVIPDNGTVAVPVTVSGLPGVITDVNATVNEITHSDGSDLDLLLVNPNGGSVVLLSDAGGIDQAASLASPTFDDSAASMAPSSGILSSGPYKPTNYDGGDMEIWTGAPAGPYGATLAALNGVNPNAVWNLYVRDDNAGDTGGFANYSVTVTSNAQGTPTTGPKPKKNKKKAKKCKKKKGKGKGVSKHPKKCKKKKGKPHQ
jgi:subtilisin-like proprotein convertase family protein